MSDKDSVEKAAIKGLSNKKDKKSPKDNTKTKAETIKEKTGKAETRKVKTGKKSKTPEKGGAESEIHRQAAKAAGIRLSEPEPKLPQKGGAEAAVHNMASKAAAGEMVSEKPGGGFGFLAMVLLFPLAIVAGLYLYSRSAPEKIDPSQNSAQMNKSLKADSPTPSAKSAQKSPRSTLPIKADKKAATTSTDLTTASKGTLSSKPATALKAGTKTGKASWNYKASNWASLDPSFKTCGSGSSQSPINIVANTSQAGPSFQYNYFPSGGKVHNTGHGVQVDLNKTAQGSGNQLLVNGKPYDLIQFHFHTPSEHAINGRHAPMEAHLVHKNAQGQLAVVAVMVYAGGPNQLIDRMPIPANKGDSNKSEGCQYQPGIIVTK